VKSASRVESRSFWLIRFQPDPIVDRVAETLFAAQISLRCLHRDLSQQELNLLQFTAGLMAKASASSTKVVRSERLDFTVLCLLLHDTPNDFGTEASSPDSASLVDRTKENARRHPGSSRPSVNSGFHPIRDWNSSYMAALTDKIGNDPVLLPLLDVLNSHSNQFSSA